ncbi:penicillin-binding protein 2 [Oceanivirga miroungae]|uniref:Penicillin-binding protein 2 n=1 Tax=Oceanivirga miroungae TaxID=1130046 RepID=A0A6I8M7Z8_9FUSO|nr:penicillin-binding protein 2 [Oceanivirga miroungae]VWL85621.1 hypothetical protein OMES3154_00906 [Oceanivirga miroungae]
MNLKREIDEENESKRYISFILIVAFIFSLLIIRLFYLQILKEDYYKEKVIKNSFREEILKPTRGKIYDKNGELLADNRTGYKLVYKNTPEISRKERNILSKLEDNELNLEEQTNKIKVLYKDILKISEMTNLSYKKVLEIFYSKTPNRFTHEIIIEDDIDVKKALIQAENIDSENIDIVEYSKRKYVEDDLASHVVGYVKNISDDEYEELKDKGYAPDDLIGKKGIEKQYDLELKGKEGQTLVEIDAKGNIIDIVNELKPVKGNDVYLSIDKNIQKKMTEYMKDTSATFIAMNVKTGKIITFISSPEIDSNKLSSKINGKEWSEIVNSKMTPLLNKGIAGLYPPGSTFKPVTGLAILEANVSPDLEILSTGRFEYGGVTFKDSHRLGHGLTNFNKAMEESVNTYFYDLSLKIPRSDFLDVASEFGVGKKTGIDIPGENSGLLPTPEWKKRRFSNRKLNIWLPGDTINMSIGQGYLLLTPIQVLMIYEAIANNGVQMKPSLVSKFVDSNDKVIEIKPEVLRKLEIDSKNLEILKKSLELPVKGKHGTAHVLNLDYVDVSAKTGTAQNSNINNHSWIAGYFPSKDPEVVFVSFVEEGGYGAIAAGRQAKKFIEEYYGKGNENGKEDKGIQKASKPNSDAKVE